MQYCWRFKRHNAPHKSGIYISWMLLLVQSFSSKVNTAQGHPATSYIMIESTFAWIVSTIVENLWGDWIFSTINVNKNEHEPQSTVQLIHSKQSDNNEEICMLFVFRVISFTCWHSSINGRSGHQNSISEWMESCTFHSKDDTHWYIGY